MTYASAIIIVLGQGIFYRYLHLNYSFCPIDGVASISYYMEETLDHTNYHVWLHFSYHLMPRENHFEF